LNLLFVGGETTDSISAIEVAGDYVFVAAGNKVLGFHRGKQVRLDRHFNSGFAYARGSWTSDALVAFIDNDDCTDRLACPTPRLPHSTGRVDRVT
jgi:hypothetical protein